MPAINQTLKENWFRRLLSSGGGGAVASMARPLKERTVFAASLTNPAIFNLLFLHHWAEGPTITLWFRMLLNNNKNLVWKSFYNANFVHVDWVGTLILERTRSWKRRRVGSTSRTPTATISLASRPSTPSPAPRRPSGASCSDLAVSYQLIKKKKSKVYGKLFSYWDIRSCDNYNKLWWISIV